MNILSILALAEVPHGSPGYDDMLRLIGYAAIIFAFFKGIQLFTRKTQTPAPAATPPTPAPAQAQPAADTLDPETLAVIAAAVACTTGSPHRVVAIKSHSSLWEKAGRQSILTSHRIR